MSATDLPVFVAASKRGLPKEASTLETFAVEVPAGTTEIGGLAFAFCKGLAQITFPPGLIHIGESAFAYCGGLMQITFPPGLVHIGESAFKYCEGLAQVTLPPGLTRIEKHAFRGCKGLMQITFPPGLTHIGSKAFDGCSSITTVLITPDLAHRPGRPGILKADAVRKIKQGGATVRWAPPLTSTLTTLGGDVVEVALPAIPSRFPADFDIAAELASAAAAELGVHRDEIYIVEGKTILYRPTITVTVVVLDTDVVDGHEIAVVRRDVAAVPMVLATECGPTDEAGTVAPTTVRCARRKIAATVFGIPEAEAEAAIQLHVGANGTGADDGQGHGFRKLGDYRDLEAGLAAAGVVDGAVVGVRARKRGWRRQRAELIPVMAPSEDGAQGGTRGWGGRQLSIV